jgi:hydroxymethylbilane synthase
MRAPARMARTVKVGGRSSRMALVQTERIVAMIRRAYPEMRCEIVTIESEGDLDRTKRIDGKGAGGLFTDNLTEALRTGVVDICVHSLKDLPDEPDETVPAVAFAPRDDPREALVLPRGMAPYDKAEARAPHDDVTREAAMRAPNDDVTHGTKANGLREAAMCAPNDDVTIGPFGGRVAFGPVGCSCARRKVQIRSIVPHIETADIRGPVPDRIALLDAGASIGRANGRKTSVGACTDVGQGTRYGSLILAAAGLDRLGLSHRATYLFDTDEMTPAAGQGIVAVQGRKGEDYFYLSGVNDPASEHAATIERGLALSLKQRGAPVFAVHASAWGNELRIIAMIGDEESGLVIRRDISGDIADSERMAARLAEELLQRDI